jgi:hypothetical protein
VVENLPSMCKAQSPVTHKHTIYTHTHTYTNTHTQDYFVDHMTLLYKCKTVSPLTSFGIPNEGQEPWVLILALQVSRMILNELASPFLISGYIVISGVWN